MTLIRYRGNLLLRAWYMCSQLAVLKAFLTLSVTTAQKPAGYGFMENALSTLFCTSCTAFKVLRPTWNPYYISNSPSFSGAFSSSCTRLRIILSYNLPIESSMHSSLHEDLALGSLFLPFGIRTSFWHFHCFGNDLFPNTC